ncbi:C-C motif chemokine 27b [Myxocyprinus asiaticus]|uniref:C-C motif chemokine 27b n=1 Tax=Myxocyprinus asiaticus TaxID=70543 RepID=UPI002223B7CA|nr:C-C motif chemokine 27b [Myxocyprinus asiaticus]
MNVPNMISHKEWLFNTAHIKHRQITTCQNTHRIWRESQIKFDTSSDLPMDLIVLGIVLSITFSAVQGATPKCCISTAKRFPLELLQSVNKYDIQTSRGACDINALVLHVENRRLCADRKMERILQRIQKSKMQNRHKKRHNI